MKVILDTSFLIELKKGNRKAVEVAKRASEVKAELMLKGMNIPDLDILIACSDTDSEILTFDRDFEPLKEI